MSKNGRTFQFWVNQLIELHVENSTFFSQITKIDDQLIYIQQPVDKSNQAVEIKTGSEVTVFFYDDLRGQCQFETELEYQAQQLVFPYPDDDDITKIERRSFFRVPANVKMYLERNIAAGIEPSLVFTQDLSGGGLSFLYPAQIARGTKLQGTLHLKTSSGQGKVDFNGKVVFTKPNNPRTYLISVEFVGMNEATRSEVLKYCISRQLELRNKIKDYRQI